MNKEELYQAMDKKGISKQDMYTTLNISRTAFYRKCNGISEFTLSEIQKMVSLLGTQEATSIFFN